MTSKPTLSRRLAAEALGTMLLIIAVVGSGVMATNLTQDVGLQLLANSGATVGALISLILMFGWVSGAHFNPVVTIAAKFLDNFSSRDIVPYVIAQTIGGCIGTVIANLMFDLDAITLSTKIRTGSNIWLSEAVATIGLLLVIFLISRSGRTSAVPFAVGVWIGGAYWFTSSTSLANPAVTLARSLTDTFAGIAPESVPMFVLMQLVGLAIALVIIKFIAPQTGFAREIGGDKIKVWSGGSEPASQINKIAIQAMNEIGIDISAQIPAKWSDSDIAQADVVITMGCGDTCPFVAGKRYEDWQLNDPAGQDIDAVRIIRDDIRQRVAALIDSLI